MPTPQTTPPTIWLHDAPTGDRAHDACHARGPEILVDLRLREHRRVDIERIALGLLRWPRRAFSPIAPARAHRISSPMTAAWRGSPRRPAGPSATVTSPRRAEASREFSRIGTRARRAAAPFTRGPDGRADGRGGPGPAFDRRLGERRVAELERHVLIGRPTVSAAIGVMIV
jgi:hypothetical protein